MLIEAFLTGSRKMKVHKSLTFCTGLFTSLGVIAILAWLAIPSCPSEWTHIDEASLATIRGTNPSYVPASGGDVCASFNTQPGQWTVFTCVGKPGDPCVLCQGYTSPSGIAGSGTGTIQPSGGAGDCATLIKWIGVCNSNAGVPGGTYTCDPVMNTTNTCKGSYATFTNQIIAMNSTNTLKR